MIENATVKNAALFLCRFLFLWKLQNRNKWFLVQIISYAGGRDFGQKKFGRVQYHVFDFVRIFAILVHFIFIRNGPKLQIRAIWKWTKIANWDRNRIFFTSKVTNHTWIAVLCHVSHKDKVHPGASEWWRIMNEPVIKSSKTMDDYERLLKMVRCHKNLVNSHSTTF